MKEKQASHQQQFWSVIPMVKVGNTITHMGPCHHWKHIWKAPYLPDEKQNKQKNNLVPPQPQGGNTHLETPPSTGWETSLVLHPIHQI